MLGHALADPFDNQIPKGAVRPSRAANRFMLWCDRRGTWLITIASATATLFHKWLTSVRKLSPGSG